MLLEFSDSDKVVLRMKDLYERKKHAMESNKPEGICTNLESIKDYLENFVAFIFGISHFTQSNTQTPFSKD